MHVGAGIAAAIFGGADQLASAGAVVVIND